LYADVIANFCNTDQFQTAAGLKSADVPAIADKRFHMPGSNHRSKATSLIHGQTAAMTGVNGRTAGPQRMCQRLAAIVLC